MKRLLPLAALLAIALPTAGFAQQAPIPTPTTWSLRLSDGSTVSCKKVAGSWPEMVLAKTATFRCGGITLSRSELPYRLPEWRLTDRNGKDFSTTAPHRSENRKLRVAIAKPTTPRAMWSGKPIDPSTLPPGWRIDEYGRPAISMSERGGQGPISRSLPKEPSHEELKFGSTTYWETELWFNGSRVVLNRTTVMAPQPQPQLH